MQDTLSPEQKKEIRDACKALSLGIRFRGGCPNCYSDAIAALWHTMKGGKVKTDSGNYYFLGTRGTYLHSRSLGQVRLDEHTPDSIIEMANIPSLYEKINN